MKKDIVLVDKKKKIYQITTTDERWYTQESKDEKTGLPVFQFIPSITWIAGHYPKGIAFYKWLASKSWDEAEAIKTSAGDKGSKVHQAIENLIGGATVKMDDKYINNSTGQAEELTVDEYKCICAFELWARETKPKFLMSETTVISEKYGFAGTTDCVAQIGSDIYVIDFKTSQYIWPEQVIQVSAYKQALHEMGRKTSKVKLAILQLGYQRNKKLYKFTEIEDKFKLFLHAKAIWENETKGQRPKQIELPMEIKLNLNDKADENAKKD